MIISNLTGGLGNQMFQYAFGRYLALKNDTYLKLHFTNALFNTQYEYGLDVFKIKAELVNNNDLKKLGVFENRIINRILYLLDERLKIKLNKNIITDQAPWHFNTSILDFKGSAYFQGYWSNEKYFKEIETTIRKDFTFKKPLDEKNKNVVDTIKKVNSVSVHVRRGDLVSNKRNDKFIGIDYYNRAVKIIEKKIKKPTYFVFSDDIIWCKKNLKSLSKNVFFIDYNKGKNSYKDMQLMSLCKHNIVANSTFSWWGAWLNKNLNKIIIKP